MGTWCHLMANGSLLVTMRCHATRRSVVNQNGAVWGLKKYEGCEVLILILDDPNKKRKKAAIKEGA